MVSCALFVVPALARGLRCGGGTRRGMLWAAGGGGRLSRTAPAPDGVAPQGRPPQRSHPGRRDAEDDVLATPASPHDALARTTLASPTTRTRTTNTSTSTGDDRRFCLPRTDVAIAAAGVILSRHDWVADAPSLYDPMSVPVAPGAATARRPTPAAGLMRTSLCRSPKQVRHAFPGGAAATLAPAGPPATDHRIRQR
ncbi:hypothetical protein M433DRAFT_384672 [Acidomyces richmondensis BFW]|nr:hypothetical protein M433DRAFT_384672 [Acidomyces richmondensis BFW]